MLNETQIGDVWLLFADFIDKKNHEAIAERYVDLLADFGVPDKVLSAASGVDATLDSAIEYYMDVPDEEGDDDEYGELEF
jgi:hypothetical protein